MKLLCICNQNIFDVKSGGSQVAVRNYNVLKDFLAGQDELFTCVISPEIKEYQEQKRQLLIPGLAGDIQSALAALRNRKCCKRKYEKYVWRFLERTNPDIVYLDTSKLGIYAKTIKRRYGKKVLVFFHNVEADYSMNFVCHRGWRYIPSYRSSLVNERFTVKYADKLLCLTQRDAKRIAELYGRCVDAVIPISFADKYEREKVDIKPEKGLLFIGSLFPPNYDGIRWFVEEVMPKLPEQKLTIVGKGFETKKKELERDNVAVVGTVEDLEEYYYTYPVVVMPIPYGSGMKVKTAEAMMYAKTIIASDEALEGYEIPESCGVYRCNCAEEYIGAVREVMQEGMEYKNQDIRKYFLNHLEYKNMRKRLEALFGNLA